MSGYVFTPLAKADISILGLISLKTAKTPPTALSWRSMTLVPFWRKALRAVTPGPTSQLACCGSGR
jgi:hypothetical protein